MTNVAALLTLVRVLVALDLARVEHARATAWAFCRAAGLPCGRLDGIVARAVRAREARAVAVLALAACVAFALLASPPCEGGVCPLAA